MLQGYSGSCVRRAGQLVEKVSSEEAFTQNKRRQADLIAISRGLSILPRIDRIEGSSIFLEYIDGTEGLTLHSAQQAGSALRLFHRQRGYAHACLTGVAWLVDLANDNLADANASLRIPLELINNYPIDALIFSEPQWIEKADGSVVFIDIEGMGMGSRYQDLGQIYNLAVQRDQPALYERFLEGYQSEPVPVDPAAVQKLAGMISIAYAGFGLTYGGPGEFEKRMNIGFRLLGAAG